MKVLLLSTSSSRNAGGLYPMIKNLGSSLLKLKNVEPVALGFRDEYSEDDVQTYAPLKLVEYNIVGPPGVGLTFDLVDKMKEVAPDIVHTNGIWLYTSRVNQKYSSKHKVPYIISPHGMLDAWILKSNPWKKKFGLALYENKHLKGAKCIQALSITEYESIRQFGLKNPVAIIPNGVFLPDKSKLVSVKPEWKSNDERKALLFLSRVHPKKGLDNLIKAWAGIADYKKEWKLVIAGESKNPEYYNTLIQLKNSLNLQNDVFFIGNQANEDKDNCFLNADAFVLSSFSEGMPVAVLEAWSYGLPTLITSGCNLPEGFANNAAIQIGVSVEDILKGLNELFTKPANELAEISKNAVKLVRESFTWESVSKQYFDVYNWMLNGGTPPDTIRFD